jgi:hypothetical protein
VLLEQLSGLFPNHHRAPEALFELGFTYEEAPYHDVKLARKYYEMLASKYPASPLAIQAKDRIENLGKSPDQELQEKLMKRQHEDSMSKAGKVQ